MRIRGDIINRLANGRKKKRSKGRQPFHFGLVAKGLGFRSFLSLAFIVELHLFATSFWLFSSKIFSFNNLVLLRLKFLISLVWDVQSSDLERARISAPLELRHVLYMDGKIYESSFWIFLQNWIWSSDEPGIRVLMERSQSRNFWNRAELIRDILCEQSSTLFYLQACWYDLWWEDQGLRTLGAGAYIQQVPRWAKFGRSTRGRISYLIYTDV